MKKETIQRNAYETRRKLLLAAETVLAEEGYIAFSENKICDRVGVTRGALRHHFPTGRYDLIKTLAESFLQQVPTGDTHNSKTRIIELIAFMHQHPRHNPLMLLMEIWLATSADKRLAEVVKPVFDQRYQVLFGVDSLEMLPEHLTPYRLMFWGAILALHHKDSDNQNLKTVIDFLNAH
ncbi:TetR/AcrR family transcriptional regulator [Serratia ureilytica]|uniref:TetR/AcrR family transcriptional regulator n=1 Tax=Serratia ureilytica TaxID=300181 RepID=UPI0039B5CBFA